MSTLETSFSWVYESGLLRDAENVVDEDDLAERCGAVLRRRDIEWPIGSFIFLLPSSRAAFRGHDHLWPKLRPTQLASLARRLTFERSFLSYSDRSLRGRRQRCDPWLWNRGTSSEHRGVGVGAGAKSVAIYAAEGEGFPPTTKLRNESARCPSMFPPRCTRDGSHLEFPHWIDDNIPESHSPLRAENRPHSACMVAFSRVPSLSSSYPSIRSVIQKNHR